MKPPRALVTKTIGLGFIRKCRLDPRDKRVYEFRRPVIKFPVTMSSSSGPEVPSTLYSVPVAASDIGPDVFEETPKELQALEVDIEKAIYRCRFLAFLGVWGSLMGSLLCFLKGCTYVAASFMEYFVSRGEVILMLVEAIDIYLVGTVMLVFGMGLYELFISNLDIAKSLSKETTSGRSNLFGLFTLQERPKWLEIKSLNELKTKLGHVIVMVLLVGMFEKSIKAVISSPVDLLCFSASILLSSGSLYLLSKLNSSKHK